MASQLHDKYEGKNLRLPLPLLFDAVVNEAVSKYNLTEEEIVNNGYRIYTELDQNYQANMQVVYENTSTSEGRGWNVCSIRKCSSRTENRGVRGLSVKLLTMIKLDSGISTMQPNQSVVLVLQLSL